MGNIYAYEELQTRKPSVYMRDPGGETLENCWITYLRESEPMALRSSTMLAVSKSTGRVVYFGSANDEG